MQSQRDKKEKDWGPRERMQECVRSVVRHEAGDQTGAWSCKDSSAAWPAQTLT